MTCNSYLSFTTSAVEAVQTLEHCLVSLLEWTRANRLKLKLDKTEILFLEGPPKIRGLSLDWIALPSCSGIKFINLGILLDPALQIVAGSRSELMEQYIK